MIRCNDAALGGSPLRALACCYDEALESSLPGRHSPSSLRAFLLAQYTYTMCTHPLHTGSPGRALRSLAGSRALESKQGLKA